MKPEYQVRPVTRYVVTRFDPEGGGSETLGEFANLRQAEFVKAQLEKADEASVDAFRMPQDARFNRAGEGGE